MPDGTLLRGEALVHLAPKELAALRLLLAHAGQIVTPVQMRQALWDDVHVTADSVPKCLSSLRAHLEPDDCIQTVYKRGYRFSAPVRSYNPDAAGPPVRLAIAPFAAIHGVPEYLGPAVAEETSARLTSAHHPALCVLAQDSVFTLARRGLSAHEIGTSLRADLVLAGTLRAFPSHFRLRAEMIRVADGTQIWIEDLLVDRSLVAGLESELARRLHWRLNARVDGDRSSSPASRIDEAPGASYASPGWNPRGHRQLLSPSRSGDEEPVSLPTSHPRNPPGLSIAAVADTARERSEASSQREAYEMFQRSHQEWQSLQRHQMQDGLQHLLRATELDPSLLAARIDLVNLCVTQAIYGFMSPAVAADTARRAAGSIAHSIPKSISGPVPGPGIDLPEHADKLLPSLGWISFHFDHDLAAALRFFSRSAHLAHDPWITRARAMFALSRHRFSEAIEILRTAIRDDPFSPWLYGRLAWALHLAGNAAESVEQAHRALAAFPDEVAANLYAVLILAFHRESDRAVLLAGRLEERVPYFDIATAVRAYALACAGNADQAHAILESLDWLSRERFVLSAFLPAVYVALEEPEAAIKQLRVSLDNRCPWFFQMLADPRLKPLEGHPEFEKMRAILPRIEAQTERAAKPE